MESGLSNLVTNVSGVEEAHIIHMTLTSLSFIVSKGQEESRVPLLGYPMPRRTS